VVGVGDRRNAFRVLVGKPGGKRPFGRPRRSWEDNIKMNIQGVGCCSVHWIYVCFRTGANVGLMRAR